MNAPIPDNFSPHNNSDASNSSHNSLGLSSTSVEIANLPNNSYSGVPNIFRNSSNTVHSEPSTNAHQTSYVNTETSSATDSNIQIDRTDFAEDFNINDINNNPGN